MAKKFLDNTGLSHLINLIQGMPDDQTIGYTTETGLHVLDGSITPNKISSLQQLRYEMGLGNTLGALPIENGGTGCSTEEQIKEWLEGLLDFAHNTGTTAGVYLTNGNGSWTFGTRSGARSAFTFSDTSTIGPNLVLVSEKQYMQVLADVTLNFLFNIYDLPMYYSDRCSYISIYKSKNLSSGYTKIADVKTNIPPRNHGYDPDSATVSIPNLKFEYGDFFYIQARDTTSSTYGSTTKINSIINIS